jgi:subfamily B ATP-binding cassette protein MsbA
MKDFKRVIRLALRYRFTFILSILCAIGVAFLWVANIGAVFPFVEIFVRGDSMQEWVDNKIEKSQERTASLQSDLKQLDDRLAKTPQDEQGAILRKINNTQSDLATEKGALPRYQQIRPYIHNYLPHDAFKTLLLVTGLLFVGTLLKGLLLIAHNILVARLAHLATFDLRKLFYRRTLRLELATFTDEGTAGLMSRFTHDMENVAAGLVSLFGKVVREPLKAIGCLIGAAFICWRLLVLSLVVAPLAAMLIHWLATTLKRANRKAMEEMAQIYSTLEETFRGIKVVKAFTNERQERKRFHDGSKKYYRKSMKIARYDALSRPMTEMMGIVSICLALLGGAWLVLQNQTHLLGIRMCYEVLGPGELIVFYAMLIGTADPFRKLSDIFTRLQRASAASERIYSRLDRESKVAEPDNPVKTERHHRDLVFDGVDFEYNPGQLVLQGIDLRIAAGETIAVVGPNGCGKSTLANLVPRFADPVAGKICLDGTPIDQMRVRDLRRQIGLVSQDTMLFDDTVLNNIRYGATSASREEVIAAARQAQAHEFIENDLSDGYDTMVGSSGGRLSGGQRQRIALARAILRDPAILILDEATSQVDLESEQAIQQVLEQFIRNRTVIIITHRLAALKLADRIVVMQSGRILDTGTHDELLGRCDLYRRLDQIQFNKPDESKAA